MQAGFNVELPSGIQILNEIRKNKSLALELKLDKGNYIPIDYTNVEYKPYLDAVNQDENKIPLWLYILLEAKTQATRYNDGLGKLGSVIVAEVILQVIKQSENTIFENNIINPIDFNILNRASIELLRCASKPEEIYLGLLYDFRRFKMTDLINFIN